MNMNKHQKNNRGLSEINLTSLVDVSLTLVIIFMVSYPLVMQSGINVSTPTLQKAKTVLEETELKAMINLKENDQVELNGSLVDYKILPDSLRLLLLASNKKIVLVSAEENVLHDRVVEALDLAKRCGADKLSIVKQK
ncbi:MAG: ExbD/TolR family protein [Candidatus Hodarchaeales archaeon]